MYRRTSAARFNIWNHYPSAHDRQIDSHGALTTPHDHISYPDAWIYATSLSHFNRYMRPVSSIALTIEPMRVEQLLVNQFAGGACHIVFRCSVS